MRKRNKVSVGAQCMRDDVVILILSLLPTKSLRRFRCVSRAWNRLIELVSTQRKILLPPSGFLTRNFDIEKCYVSIAPDSQCDGDKFKSRFRRLPFYSTCRVVDSCNGLVLVTQEGIHSPSIYYVWNPITMEYVALPKVPAPAGSFIPYHPRDCFLAYNPSQSPHYKVVRFTRDKTYTSVIVELYFSMTGRWTKSSVPRNNLCYFRRNNLYYFRRPCNNSVFHRGALYYLQDEKYLICFDIKNLSFHLTILPTEKSVRVTRCIGESRGQLYYAVSSTTRFNLKIYILEELDKWQLMHKISTNDKVLFDYFCPIAFHPDSEVIYLKTQKKIFSFDLGTRKLEEVQVIDYVYSTPVFLFIPCLESIYPPGSKFISEITLESATSSQTSVSEVDSSSHVPQCNAGDAVFDRDIQVAIEDSLQGPDDPQPLIPATNSDLDKQVVKSGKRSVSQPDLGKSVSGYEDLQRGKSTEEPSDAFVTGGTSGIIRPITEGSTMSAPLPSFSTQAYDTLALMASPAELEKLLSELSGTALVPSLRQNGPEKSKDELTEEWADVCSKVLCITSYLAIVKGKFKWENLASRLDNLKALKSSFDCSPLIRCFDHLMDYVQVVEKDNVDITESILQTSYYPSNQLHEDKKSKIVEKLALVEAAASQVMNKIAGLECELTNTHGRISDLRKIMAEEEAKVDKIHTSLETEKQKEIALINEKALIAAEQAVLEVQSNELEEYRVKVSSEAKINLEKMKNLVKQLVISLSKFDLRDSPSPWEKE